MNSMKEDINNLIEELTNVRPDELSTEGLKLFNKINEIIDKNKELEEERQIVGMPVRNKRDGRIGIVLHQWKSGSVAVLESINPRVINTHDNWNTLEIVTDEVKQTQTKCDSIPVSLVEETIEKLKENGYWNYLEKRDLETTIEILQKLLEKRK